VGVEQLDEHDDMVGLICSVAEVGSHLVSLPMAGMLPTLTPERESIASYLGQAIGASGEDVCAMKTLISTFQFLGGEFVDQSPYAVKVLGDAPPKSRLERWSWLCRSAFSAKEEADALWRKLVDPVQ